MTHGIDVEQLDSSIRPQDDLFRHVNGRWLRETQIPADRATAGAFMDLRDAAELKTREIIERAQQSPADDEERKIGELYASFMDTERIEALGGTPLQPDLAAVDAIDSVGSFARTLGSLERSGVGTVVGMYVAPDKGAPDTYVAYLVQTGLGLPDESYYRGDENADLRDAYVVHVTRMLELAGLDDAPARAERVMALETAIAERHWDRVATRDAQKTYNPMSYDELRALLPALDWDAWAEAAQIPASVLAKVVVSQPTYYSGLADLLVEDRLEQWKDWLRWNVVHAAASYLSEEFVAENFDFYGRTLSGTDELRERWKRGVGFVEGAMGEAVGKVYVRTEYPDVARERMGVLIENLMAAYRESITALPWMSDTTKAQALDKLSRFDPKIGHPRTFRDYSALETDPTDLLGNRARVMAVEVDRELAKVGGPIDRDEWYMTPQTVNAYYNPTMNEIVFPAAILQPPFFDAEADDAVNYGAIGAVIGHEIGHGFDDQGSHYDGSGALRNWWTDEDRAAFEQLTGSLVAQYDPLSPEGADGATVNGSLTIGENIGDLGGLGIALKAYLLARGDEVPEPIDGYTDLQRFFLSWAVAWQGKTRPAETLRRLTVDPHSPPEFRCNQVVRNIDAFYEAFDVKPDDALWLDESERVTIW
ncbi:M13-type metalloendopeptidase [Aeromicrobium sp. IC_218]|uniref:M13 family metallopeptidase n=1 Tax=Aeromicrobium sp. IC_218 TaxID=2545468 RepID=UPI00103AE78E|nr:M13-type metalloendopeptidase [Aeromicrobium sp. IC_218]TCI97385.1 peptidase M13 [Aeromicrobium sp. IC_218]